MLRLVVPERALCSWFVLGCGVNESKQLGAALNFGWLIPAGVALGVVIAGQLVWSVGARLLAPLDKPYRSTPESQTTRPWPPGWRLATLFIGFLGVVGFAGALYGVAPSPTIARRITSIGLGCFLGLLTWCSFLTCLPSAQVTWSDSTIEDPSSQFVPMRRTLAWGDVVRLGKTSFGYFFVEDQHRQKVFWSSCYVAHTFLVAAILNVRPDLRSSAQRALIVDV